MAIFVDIYGTITEASGTTGSPVVISNLPMHGESLVWDSDSEIWKASIPASELGLLTDVDTTTTPATHLTALYYDSDTQKWEPRKLINREESFVVDSDEGGKDTFVLPHTPHEVTHFFRNGMRLVKAAWEQSDSDVVYYYQAQNGNSPVASGDEIQITYNTISE